MSDKTIKVEHFKNLVAVAAADGFLDENEMDFLTEKAEEIGISKEDVDTIISQKDKLQFMVPMNMVDREDQLADIVYMSMIDGEIHDNEYQLCLNIAERLGLTKSDLDEAVDLTKRLWEK
ncbi:MAG TPA: hypothetical protein DCE41_24985 [Cytophagales bacterium]|nr:hypothetical protein [Cytophagales bacterium]HAA18494.1 hypothetical protein [Cytophagales bacterium]HAP58503.1 hypothetical protein [Cytophagales bacterium]